MAHHVVAREHDAGMEPDHRLDGLAQDFVGHAHDRRFGHAVQPMQDFLDLARTHLLAARLDDVVLAADEIQIALIVGPEQIAGVEHHLTGQRARLEDPARFVRQLPVAFHHVRSANDQLTHHAGTHARAPIVDDVHLFVGHAASNRRRTDVNLIGRQVRHALALGESVHRINGRRRKRLAELTDLFRREHRRRVRDVAQARKVLRFQVELQQDRGDRRHDRKPGDVLAAQRLHQRVRIADRLLEHERAADLERHQDLIEAVVERQGQHVQHDVVRRVLQVRRDRRRRRDDVQVRQHHALGPAGRTRGVDQRRQIDVDALPSRRLGHRGGYGVERHGVLAGRGLVGTAADKDAGQMRGVRPQVWQRLQLPGVGDEARGAAVVQDVRELLRLDARIDDQEHAAGLERGKDRHHGVGGVVQIHGDTIGSAHAGVDHRVRERVRPLVDLSIGPALAVAHQRDFVGEAARAALEEFFYLHVVLPVVADRKVRTVFVVAAVVSCSRSPGRAYALQACPRRKSDADFTTLTDPTALTDPT